jgi:hypothetical protein
MLMRRALLLAALIAVFLFVLMAGTGLAAATILLGNSSVASLQDNDAAGLAEAFDFSASASGSAQSISVYVDSGSTASGLAVGLYADSSGHPGSLLASGSTSAPTAGQWNQVTLNSTPTLSSGTTYWLAVLGTGGQLSFRDVGLGTGSCSENSSQTNLTSLPSNWSSGATFTTCSLSAYVNGTASSTTTSAPANAALPTITGMPQQGQTLAASTGTWTGTGPITYTYLWSDGAKGSTDTLGAGDVGQNISVAVTATNSAGSVSATSAGVGPVTASGGGGSVQCALTHAAGFDGTNSCWATHTGVQGSTGYTEAQIEANPTGLGFTKITHDVIITQPNTTIDHEWIVGCIQIADGADNAVVKNSLVMPNGSTCAGDNAGGSAINTGQGPNIAKNTLIEDTTVDDGTSDYGSNDAGLTVDAGEVLRVNAFGFARTFLSGTNTAQYPALFQDDYTHNFSGCVHDDGTWFNTSSYVTFDHSYVLMGDAAGSGCTTAALSGGSDYGPQDHITYDSNYAYGADGEAVHTGCGSTQMTITNNAIDNGTYKNGSDGGYQALTGNAWSGNYSVDDNTGANLGSWGPFSAPC